jgi:hypothetical protein
VLKTKINLLNDHLLTACFLSQNTSLNNPITCMVCRSLCRQTVQYELYGFGTTHEATGRYLTDKSNDVISHPLIRIPWQFFFAYSVNSPPKYEGTRSVVVRVTFCIVHVTANYIKVYALIWFKYFIVTLEVILV